MLPSVRTAFRLCLLVSFFFPPLVAVHASESFPAEAPVGWWRDAVFYELFVRSFADATQGPLAHDGIGDLEGLIERLDYLNDGQGQAGHSLGVTALWLMPIQPSPSYHGYDVSNYFAVNPEYGDIALCKRFVQEAHRRGIRVIIDLVLNHASSKHPLFITALAGGPRSEARALFRFSDLPEDLSGPSDQRVWHPGGGQFYYGIFSADMPDWNFRNPAVTEHHRRAAKFWLRDVGVDGFRLDAVRYFYEQDGELQDVAETRQWLKEFTDYCHEVKPGAFVVGENTARMPEVARYIRGGSLDSAFEFDLARAIIEAVRLRTPGILDQTLQRLTRLYGDDCPWSTFLTNHDQARVKTQLDGNDALTRLATKVMFTLPGIPFVYYGEELGMTAGKPDPQLRTPMPWTGESPNAGFALAGVRAWEAPRPDFAETNVAREAETTDSMLMLYRRLVQLNESSPALRHGRVVPLVVENSAVYAEMRETTEEVVLVLGNFSTMPLHGPTLRAARSAAQLDWLAREELENAKVALPTFTAAGGFEQWIPLAELAPESLYVVRLKK